MCRQLVKLREILLRSVERSQIARMCCRLHLLHRLIRLVRLASYGLAMLPFLWRLHKNRRQLGMSKQAGSIFFVHVGVECLVFHISFQPISSPWCLLSVAQLVNVWFLLRFNFAIVLVTAFWLIIWNFADTTRSDAVWNYLLLCCENESMPFLVRRIAGLVEIDWLSIKVLSASLRSLK